MRRLRFALDWTVARFRLARTATALWIVLAILLLLRPFKHVRLATFRTDRVGHFISDTDLALALLPETRDSGARQTFVFVMPDESSNEQIRTMYMRSVSAMPDARLLDCRTSWLARRLVAAVRLLTSKAQYKGVLRSFYCGSPDPGGIDSCGLRPSGRPHIRFLKEELDQAWAELGELGIDAATPYICIHIRDGAYLRETQPGRDWGYHGYRNPDPLSYVDVIHRAIELGFVVIRMGQVTESPLPVASPAYIDYSRWEGRSALLDVALYAHASLCVSGGASGIDQLGWTFDTPSVVTNFVPFEDPRFAISQGTVIPCLLRDGSTGRALPLSESLQHRYSSSHSYRSAGIEVLHNSPEEITAVVEEAIARVQGTWSDDGAPQTAQDRFWDWADLCGMSSRVPDGPWMGRYYRCRLGTAFLTDHADLLMS